jgi:hypothetical protein
VPAEKEKKSPFSLPEEKVKKQKEKQSKTKAVE